MVVRTATEGAGLLPVIHRAAAAVRVVVVVAAAAGRPGGTAAPWEGWAAPQHASSEAMGMQRKFPWTGLPLQLMPAKQKAVMI